MGQETLCTITDMVAERGYFKLLADCTFGYDAKSRAEAAIAVEIWRRAATMSLMCWLRVGAEDDEA